MRAPVEFMIIGATILILLMVVISEIHEWRLRRSSAKRYSAKTRALIYVGIYVLTLAIVLFPKLGDALHHLGGYVIAIVAVLFVLFCALLLLLVRVGIPGVNRVFQEARELDDAGRTLDAITLLENNRAKARRWGKTFEAVLLSNVAGLYAKLRDWPRALATSDEAIRAAPEQAAGHATKGQILCSAGQREEALQFLNGVLFRFEKSVQLQTVLAETQTELGQITEATATLDRVDQILNEEAFVDVLDRDEWRKIRLGVLRSRVANSTTELVRDE